MIAWLWELLKEWIFFHQKAAEEKKSGWGIFILSSHSEESAGKNLAQRDKESVSQLFPKKNWDIKNETFIKTPSFFFEKPVFSYNLF